MSIDSAYGFQLTRSGTPLERTPLTDLHPGPREVVVQVAGCGVCHTDIGFALQGIPTRHPLPLVLGHEIAGHVVAAGDGAGEWLGRAVIVPAVVPCGVCSACKIDRPTICRDQFMPGNHGHGGFATHVRVPANGLCPVPDQLPGDLTLDKLSVIADAVTTPLEAIHRARLVAGDIAIFVGVGGVGGFGVQVASAMGSRVVAIDIDQGRLDLAARHGASLILNSTTMELKQIKKTLRSFAEQSEDPSRGLKIFETSGSPAGQQLAYGLIGPGAHLAVVGYTAEPIELHLSNLMAFDATAQGNWGSHPARYPEALQFVLDERIALQPYVQTFPLDQAPEVIAAVAHHEIEQRAILVPTQE